MRTTALAACLVLAGCATSAGASRASTSASQIGAVRRQLAGHLERARGCFTDGSIRDRNAGGLVEVAFTIRRDGRVDDVDVQAWSLDERVLEACVRSRIVSLYFDPAPRTRDVRIERTLAHCPDAREGVCPLGPIGALSDGVDRALLARVAESLADRDDALRECAADAGGGSAVLDVRLELTDGRIMAGQVRRRLPADTPIGRCGVAPLLGSRVEGPVPERTVQLRYVYRIDATTQARLGAR